MHLSKVPTSPHYVAGDVKVWLDGVYVPLWMEFNDAEGWVCRTVQGFGMAYVERVDGVVTWRIDIPATPEKRGTSTSGGIW